MVKPSAPQPTISSFFSQKSTPNTSPQKSSTQAFSSTGRHSYPQTDQTPIDLTFDSDSEAPPVKKKKLSHNPGEVVEPERGSQWRYTSNTEQSSSAAPVTKVTAVPRDIASKKRQTAIREKLLGDNNPFIRKSSVEAPFKHKEASDEASDNGSDSEFRGIMDAFKNSSVKEKARAVKPLPTKPSVLSEEIGSSGEPYTPLEKQILKLKKENPGTILMVEVGYKYRFFGEDAQVASKELGIVCFPDRNFLTAGIPVHRRDIHLKKLLSQGYRVGIVGQIETAALKKAGDNRNAPFERAVTDIYTAVTYVDELDSVDDLERYTPPPLMCLVENLRGGMGADDLVRISMLVITPSTGDIIWDDFEDSHMRIELETRMAHIKPSELLLPAKGLSGPTEKMLKYFSDAASGINKFRTERMNKDLSYSEAFSYVSEFYATKAPAAGTSNNTKSDELISIVTGFPKPVVIALAMSIKHLSIFGLADALLQAQFFEKFTQRTHMLLNGNTLANLEIYRNQTDFTIHGSLIWVLDKTQTRFGARLLKTWLGKPLIDSVQLRARLDAIDEIISSPSDKLVILRALLRGAPDLAKGLCRIQYGKCAPQELVVLIKYFKKAAVAFESFGNPTGIGFKSDILNNIIYSLVTLQKPIKELEAMVLLREASQGNKSKMYTDAEKYPELQEFDGAIQVVLYELEEELKSIKKLLKRPSLKWTTYMQEEYVIELAKTDRAPVPLTWTLLSSTKSVVRYHTPEVKKYIGELARYRESLEAAADQAYFHFLKEITGTYYVVMRNAVKSLANADCLMSLAQVASQEGYIQPQFTSGSELEIVDGRHPMIEVLKSDPFVPNSCTMGGESQSTVIITGPNMGGKSSAVRMIALICIMAQLGSYVPATSVRLGMLDSILTRMGASDELVRGKSTFMVEMSETSEILSMATEKSLVILDELGRGTSTFDGMAIASATLEHLIQNVRCKTLFITHYPLIATEIEKKHPEQIHNMYMGFTEDTRVDGRREITFLYRLTKGIALESFGIECARLAGLSESLLNVAIANSSNMRKQVEGRAKRVRVHKALDLIHRCLTKQTASTDMLRNLRQIVHKFDTD